MNIKEINEQIAQLKKQRVEWIISSKYNLQNRLYFRFLFWILKYNPFCIFDLKTVYDFQK